MRQLLDLYQHVLTHGVEQQNRTGTSAIFIPGAMMKFDMSEGFPLVTTKQTAFRAIRGETCGHLNAFDNAASFRAWGCNVWDANANEHGKDVNGNFVENKWLSNPNRKGKDDLGRIYGVQWRKWRGQHTEIDQVARAVQAIKHDPTNRRILISAWRPDEFDQMALPPCHVSYHFMVDVKNNKLHLSMLQRSCDLFLGVPFNISMAALFLYMMCEVTDRIPGTFTHFLEDAHIYTNHVEQVKEQLSRKPKDLPSIIFTTGLQNAETLGFRWRALEDFHPDHIQLEGYDPHPAIKGVMAV